jgi:hypothetical protein
LFLKLCIAVSAVAFAMVALGASAVDAASGVEVLNAGGDVVDRALVAIPFLVILALVARSVLPKNEE